MRVWCCHHHDWPWIASNLFSSDLNQWEHVHPHACLLFYMTCGKLQAERLTFFRNIFSSLPLMWQIGWVHNLYCSCQQILLCSSYLFWIPWISWLLFWQMLTFPGVSVKDGSFVKPFHFSERKSWPSVTLRPWDIAVQANPDNFWRKLVALNFTVR